MAEGGLEADDVIGAVCALVAGTLLCIRDILAFVSSTILNLIFSF